MPDFRWYHYGRYRYSVVFCKLMVAVAGRALEGQKTDPLEECRVGKKGQLLVRDPQRATYRMRFKVRIDRIYSSELTMT